MTLFPPPGVLPFGGDVLRVMASDRRGSRGYVRDVEIVTWSRICAEWGAIEFCRRYRISRPTSGEVDARCDVSCTSRIDERYARRNNIPVCDVRDVMFSLFLRFCWGSQVKDLEDLYKMSRADGYKKIHMSERAVVDTYMMSFDDVVAGCGVQIDLDVVGDDRVRRGSRWTFDPHTTPPGPGSQKCMSRKCFFALNIQAIADAKLRFLKLVVASPGATNDALAVDIAGITDLARVLRAGYWLAGDVTSRRHHHPHPSSSSPPFVRAHTQDAYKNKEGIVVPWNQAEVRADVTSRVTIPISSSLSPGFASR